jgi:hypothetical protein
MKFFSLVLALTAAAAAASEVSELSDRRLKTKMIKLTEVSTKILDGFPHLFEYRILRLTCRATPD